MHNFQNILSKKFCEEIIAYFPFIQHGLDRKTRQQAIAKTFAEWSAYQIPSVIVVFVVLVCEV
jgi:hypothetical protein